MNQRADAGGVQQGPDPDRATEQPPDYQNRHLDRGADATDRLAAGGQCSHQAISGSWAQAGTDVEGRGDTVHGDAPYQVPAPGNQTVHLRQDRRRDVDAQPDQYRIRHRANAGSEMEMPNKARPAASADMRRTHRCSDIEHHLG